MRNVTWAVVTAMGLGLAVHARGDDPPAAWGDESQQAVPAREPGPATSSAESATAGAQSTALVEEVRTGAASMEPSDAETGEERVERAFVESIWNSP